MSGAAVRGSDLDRGGAGAGRAEVPHPVKVQGGSRCAIFTHRAQPRQPAQAAHLRPQESNLQLISSLQQERSHNTPHSSHHYHQPPPAVPPPVISPEHDLRHEPAAARTQHALPGPGQQHRPAGEPAVPGL